MKRSQTPIPNPLVVLKRRADGCAVLFNPDTADAVEVNLVGVAVWGLIDGRRSLEDILQAVRSGFTGVPDTVADDVAAFVADLAARGFVGIEQGAPATQVIFSPRLPPLEDSVEPIVPTASGPLGRPPDDVLFFAYRGSSMDPTLAGPDLLEVAPYRQDAVRVGDVIAIAPPEGGHRVVHRVVRVTPEGICTRGDNNAGDDSWRLQPGQVIGRVAAAWRGRRKRRVLGGRAGHLWARLTRWRRTLDRAVSRLLHPLYRGLARSGVVHRLWPFPLRPRAVVFGVGESARLRLLLGRRVVGQYEGLRRGWRIWRPFRLFVDEAALEADGGVG